MNITKQNCYVQEVEKAYREGFRLYINGGVLVRANCIKKFF